MAIAGWALSLGLWGMGLMSEASAQESYYLSSATYLGGSKWDMIRGLCTDPQGNLYVTGGTSSTNFPTTAGAYCRSFHPYGGTPPWSAGNCDVFVTKFDPAGQLVWSTLLGGTNYDRAYTVKVDGQGYVYVSGRAGEGFPVTNAFQPNFMGNPQSSSDTSTYGRENSFIAKLTPDGSSLVWSSYIGVGVECRDMALDTNGDIYVGFPYGPGNYSGYPHYDPPAAWLTNAYQKTFKGGANDSGVCKVKGDGSGVVWATYLGGSGDDGNQGPSVCVDAHSNVIVFGYTLSTNFPTTDGTRLKSAQNCFLTKFRPDGANLVFSTIVGGTGSEYNQTHNVAVDAQDNIYVEFSTTSTDLPVTVGCVQPSYGGGGDMGLAVYSPTGSLLACTYLGGSGFENMDGLSVDAAGNVLVTAGTPSANFPVTNAFQAVNGGGNDVVLARLSSDLRSLLYSTYIGGSASEMGRITCLGPDGSLCVAGQSTGSGWPTQNAWQTNFGSTSGEYNGIIARFAPHEPPRITSLTRNTNDVQVAWSADGGLTNVVQATSDLTGSFTNISPNVVVTGIGRIATNYAEPGGATHQPTRFYRVRQMP